MAKRFTCFFVVAVMAGFSTYFGMCRADDASPSGVIAHFRFNGNAKDDNPANPDFELKNTKYIDDALYLNGKYEDGGFPDGFRAVCKTPNLDFSNFTVALRFKPEDFGPQSPDFPVSKNNVITAGTSDRWFGMYRSDGGNLTIMLNNHSLTHEIDGVKIDKGKWMVVACAVDLSKSKIVVFANGVKAADFELPKDFHLQLDTTPSEKDVQDKWNSKLWSFTDYSGGNVLQGLVDELIIYGKALSNDELARIPLRVDGSSSSATRPAGTTSQPNRGN